MKTKNIGFWPWILRFAKKSKEQKEKEIVEAVLNNLDTFRHAERERRKFQNRPANSSDEIELDSNGDIIGKMYDFYRNFDDQADFRIARFTSDEQIKKEDDRIAKKPLEVLKELEEVPLPWDANLENLEIKIASLKDKKALSNQHYAKEQIEGLIKRLENRKKYAENVAFFSSFPNTTDDKIEALVEKYKLVMKTSELFIPSFPDDAIATMKEYTKVCKSISGESPVFYVIAEEKDFKTKEKKLDPILLAQSPFGFYWQILGAWDKEMLLLSEL